VVLALVANFALVPLLAFVLAHVIPLSDPLKIGLILLGTAAGAPFLPKLAQFAHGNVACSVGLMALLMLATIVYMPIVLPLLLPGVRVDPLSIAESLCLTMLLPLGVALFVRARYPEPAQDLQPMMGQVSTVALVLLFVTSIVANFHEIIGVIGTGGIISALILIGGGFIIGSLLGGPSRDIRGVLGLGTAQRNISAAVLVGAQHFTNPNVLAMVMVGSIVSLLVLFPIAGELGKRTAKQATGKVTGATGGAMRAAPDAPARDSRPAAT
jgi:predicted Na+-dependent transporter